MPEGLVVMIIPAVLRILQRWRPTGNTLTRGDLCVQVGCNDRVLREAIAELRKAGHLIVVDKNGGYRFARNGDEVYVYVRSLQRNIRALVEVCDAMAAAAALQYGEPHTQTEMFPAARAQEPLL